MHKFKDIQFDAIIFSDVLEHIIKPEDVLKKLAENKMIYLGED